MAGESSTRFRAPIATLVAAVMLATAGVVALVFQPAPASAGPTPGVKPDFTMKAGDTATETYARALHGSAELKGQPDQCRTDTVYRLTCAAHRVKLQRTAGVELRVVLEWAAQGDAAVAQVPDIDMYIFNEPASSFDSTVVGGAGATMPETAVLVPEQDEYDIVVQAYAGSITEYKLTLYYGAPQVVDGGSGEGASVTPDIVLTPKQPPFIKEYTSALVGQPGLAFFPEGCRTDPTSDAFCDVFRIKANRNKAKDAINYVVITLEWDVTRAPDLQTPALGLVGQPVPRMDMYVYDTPDHSLDGVGGTGIIAPQRVGFIATQDEYDLVIQVYAGASAGYKITAFMTDELFDKPFEVLDPVTGQPIAPAVDPETGAFDPSKLDQSGGGSASLLDLAPIDVDDQIAGIGLGTTEQFDREEALRLGQAELRNVSITNDPPAAWILWLAMLVVPAGFGMFFVVIMRRRHQELV